VAEEGLKLLWEVCTLHLAPRHRFSQLLDVREVISYYSPHDEHKGWAIIDVLKGWSPAVCFFRPLPQAPDSTAMECGPGRTVCEHTEPAS